MTDEEDRVLLAGLCRIYWFGGFMAGASSVFWLLFLFWYWGPR